MIILLHVNFVEIQISSSKISSSNKKIMTLEERLEKYLAKEPSIDDSAYVSKHAVLIGDVTIAKDASVWPGCVLRADINSSLKSDIASSSGMPDEGIRPTRRSLRTGKSVSPVSGSVIEILICTGPFSPESAVSKASFTQRLKYQPSVGNVHSARKSYECFTK